VRAELKDCAGAADAVKITIVAAASPDFTLCIDSI
jgi:hypothetical protein